MFLKLFSFSLIFTFFTFAEGPSFDSDPIETAKEKAKDHDAALIDEKKSDMNLLKQKEPSLRLKRRLKQKKLERRKQVLENQKNLGQ